MKIIGLTGGIGSGKTTIANYFEAWGIPFYKADAEAKKLMNASAYIKRELINLFGEKAYVDGELNKTYLSHKIFSNQELLKKMNAVVHPKVAEHFKKWVKQQKAPYVIKEAAVIFENNLQDQYDYIITVVADENERIKRVTARDNSSQDKVKAIINNQWSDQEKIKHSDFVIYNNDREEAKAQAKKIHDILCAQAT